jgi:L-lysine 2,3-aminomutase
MLERETKHSDISMILGAYNFEKVTIQTIADENLLSPTLINRLQNCYPQHSGLLKDKEMFTGKTRYIGLNGFREILEKLRNLGIVINDVKEREFFLEVYRFMATKHILNCINWEDFKNDPIYHLVFPQPGMINKADVTKYVDAKTDEERKKVVLEYQQKTNPHDGKQLLNKPFFINSDDELEILAGCQHKYPPVKLVLDKGTQNCFAFCTYCFRHAQVRGDEDMFVQDDISQVHEYLKKHPEVSDVLITGGDGGYITYDRLKAYVTPFMEDKDLTHIRTLRIGSRVLTFHPEFVLGENFKPILELLKTAVDSGIQVVWMSHFSTPRELLNPGTLAAVKRLKNYGLTLKSQSPIMNHISLYCDEKGVVDVDRSAQNWIDLGNVLAMLGIGFHSMYCARPTGEHHYFTASLANISKIFNKVYRSLASINRPSRYITMTSSSGKTSLMGTAEINGDKVFVLKFNEARNMEWMDTTYFAEYDEKENTIEKLKPYKAKKYFYQDELASIENQLEEALKRKTLKLN